MDLEVRPWKMVFSMVRFLKEPIYKAFGPLTRCKSNVDPRGMTMHQKVNMLIFFNMCSKKKNPNLTVLLSPLSYLHLLYPKHNSLKNYNITISLPWALAFFY